MSEIEIISYSRTAQIGPKFLSQISRNSKILPITFYAETLEDAVKKADKFWKARLPRVEKKAEEKAKGEQ